MQTVQVNIFKYNELSQEAQKRARDWYRNLNSQDSSWSDFVIEDAKEVGKRLGFEIDKVYFSGFYSQGSGACFEGTFRSSQFKLGEIQQYTPQDKELHRIAAEIEKIVNQFYAIHLKVRHSGHYYHKFCTNFEVSITDNEDNEIDTKEAADAEKYLIELSRDLMEWIYRALEKEYEYLNEDEQIAESLIASNFDFEENGKVWH